MHRRQYPLQNSWQHSCSVRRSDAIVAFLPALLVFGFVWVSLIISISPVMAEEADLPLQLVIKPQKQIYTAREGVMLRFEFKATRSVNLCLENDPLTQLSVKIFRGGKGELPIAPIVVNDTQVLFHQKPRVIPLGEGDTYLLRINLKRFGFLNGEKWMPGDYTVKGAFTLCDQTQVLQGKRSSPASAQEITIPASESGRFMIMN